MFCQGYNEIWMKTLRQINLKDYEFLIDTWLGKVSWRRNVLSRLQRNLDENTTSDQFRRL